MVDAVIVGIFLLATTIAGYCYGRKTKSFQDYAVGNRKMSNTKMAISLIATTGGMILHTRLETYYRQGLYAFVLDFSSKVFFYLVFSFVIIRMKEFVKHFSVAESMGSLYGPMIRLITGITSILMTIAILIVQLKMGLYITHYLFPGIGSIFVSILLILLVMAYATLGGAKTVALTDVCQFFLFGIGFPILIFILFYYSKYPLVSWSLLTTLPQFNLDKLGDWHRTLTGLLAYFIWRPEFPFDPARIQRFYMVSSLQQAAKVLYKSVWFQILIAFFFLSVSLALHLGGHMIQPHQYVLDYIMELAYFPGMRGILLSAIIALLISKADANLHTASVLFAHDIWPILRGPVVKSSRLKIARMTSVLLGMVSLYLVGYVRNVEALLDHTIHLYSAAVTIPFLMAILGFRPRRLVVLLTMTISVGLSFYRIYTLPMVGPQDILEALLCSTVLLLLLHYLLPQRPHTGWVGIKERSPIELYKQEIKRWWAAQLHRITLPFTKRYLETIFPKKESTFIGVGSYCMITTTVTLFFLKKSYVAPYIYAYMAVIAASIIVALYPAFHFYKPGGSGFMQWAWLLFLFMVFFVANIQWVKLSQSNSLIWLLFVCNLGVVLTFLSVFLYILMLVIALLLHTVIPPYFLLQKIFYPHTLVLTDFITAIAFGMAIIASLHLYKRLRIKMSNQLHTMHLTRTYERRIALAIAHNQANWSRLDATYGNKILLEMGEKLQKPYLYRQDQEALVKAIDSCIQKLHLFSNFLPLRINIERHLELDPKKVAIVDIASLIAKAHDHIRALGIHISLLVQNETVVTQLLADPELLEYLLTINLLEISKQAADHMVTLTIQDTMLHYNGTIAKQTNTAALTLPALAFFISTDSCRQQALTSYPISGAFIPIYLPKSEKYFYQSDSKQIVQAHGGYMEAIESDTVLTCCYVLPLTGKKVMRWRSYDPAQLANVVAETAESLAQEKELITLLTTETVLTKEAAEKTIALIKNAHGLVVRKSGEPYYTHPMTVTKILLEITKEPATLLAGLLHDVIEDTSLTLAQIELMYDADVAHIVDMVTHYNTNGYPWKFDKEENNSILYECQDIRIVQVKFVDRLHNIRTLYARKPADQKRIALETILFYIPWGRKHHMLRHWLVEMQQICEQILLS